MVGLDKSVVEDSMPDSDLRCLCGPVPVTVQLRQKLNNAGFKFADDGELSVATNVKPEPLGEFSSWYDISSQTTHYKQTL